MLAVTDKLYNLREDIVPQEDMCWNVLEDIREGIMSGW